MQRFRRRPASIVAQQYLAAFTGEEGVLFIGKAQEKASVFRTEKRRDAHGKTYPWIIRSTAMPNQYYIEADEFRLVIASSSAA